MKGRLVLLIVAVLAASFGVATAGSAAAAGCRVDYKVTSQWAGGFGAETAAPMVRRILAELLDVKESGVVQGGAAPD